MKKHKRLFSTLCKVLLIFCILIPNSINAKDKNEQRRKYLKSIRFDTQSDRSFQDDAIVDVIFDLETNLPKKITWSTTNDTRKFQQEFTIKKISNIQLDEGLFEVDKFSKEVYIKILRNGYVKDVTRFEKIKGLQVSIVGEEFTMIVERSGKEDIAFVFSRYFDVNSLNHKLLLEMLNEEPNIEKIGVILDSGADIDKQYFESGKTVLYMACAEGYSEIIELLVSKGADVNITTDSGDSPLCLASKKDSTEIIKLLVENGADVNYCDANGYSALHINILLYDNYKTVEYLIEHGADVNKLTNDGWSPLYIASQNEYLDIVKLLIENGAVKN